MPLQFDTRESRPAGPAKTAPPASARPLGRGRRAGAADRMFFTEQLALLLETGESLYSALATIARQTANPRMRTIVEQLANDVSEGGTFSHALQKHPAVFPLSYSHLVAASESGGFLPEVLAQLLVLDRKRDELRSVLVSAATYPAFLIVFSIAVVAFVLVVVFPKFGTMFTSIYDQLPASTKALMALSDLLRDYWPVVLAAIGLSGYALHRWLKTDAGRLRIDNWKLKIPGIRDIFTQIYVVQALQVLGMALNNGVSVMDSLEACREVVSNARFRRLFSELAARVESGSGLAAGFAESSIVPDLVKHMVATGEETGHLGKVMIRVSDYYEAQLTRKLAALSKLAEPVMLLIMGAMVGVLVSSLILPIFKLSRAVY